MTKHGAVALTVIGAVGLLTIGAFVATGGVPGRFSAASVVTPTNCSPRQPQGSVVDVNLNDRGAMMGGDSSMMVSIAVSPSIVSSGTVTFVATNTGAINHELLIFRSPGGVGTRAVKSGGKINETTSLAEASTSCGRGPGYGISPGTTGWVTLTMAPGNYEVLCDVPWHYADGMFTGFTVR